VTLKDRTIYGGEWNTLCLPFSLTKAEMEADDSPLKGADVRRLNSSFINDTNDTLTLSFTDKLSNVSGDNDVVISAGVPYLIKPANDDIVNPTFKNVTITISQLEDNDYTKTSYVDFMPCLIPSKILGTNKNVLYMGDENKVYNPKNDVTINSFRGYFKVAEACPLLNKGDVNGNNQITIADVVVLVNHILGKSSDNFIIQNADINGNGKITIADAVGLVNIILQGNPPATNIIIKLGDDTITYGGATKVAGSIQ